MVVFGIMAIVGTLLLATGVAYLYVLVGVALLAGKEKLPPTDAIKFLILVPAYNESSGIVRTIESLKALNNSGESRIVVIADNCDDDTAQIAAGCGVKVLERFDPMNRGKGYALEWTMNQYNLLEYDAVAVIDADTTVEENMLEVMTGLFSGGADAIQLNYLMIPQRPKGVAYLQYLASLTENHLYYGPRQKLGMAILLRGSGMAIKSRILQQFPWNSHSITEDVDYSIALLRAGKRIYFSALSTVRAASPESLGQSYSQKKRWTSGTIALVSDNILPLLKTGLIKGEIRSLELAFSLLLISRPSMIYFAFLMVILAMLGPPNYLPTIFTINVILSAAVILYLFLGIYYCEDKVQALKTIPLIPVYGIWYLFVQLRSLLGIQKREWIRTKRDTDE